MPGRYIIGLLLVAVGVMFLLQYLGVVPWYTLQTWWPVIIIVLGLNSLLKHPTRPWGALIVVLVGVMLQLWKLGLLPANLWPVILAMALILIGLRMLLPRRRPWPVATANVRDRVNDSVSFGNQLYRNDSRQFEGGRVSASFSNYELDLRGAALAPGGADLELNVSFGEIKLRVPDTWALRVNGIPVFGSCTNRTRQSAADLAGGPVLRVKCHARFGSVEITN